jgi:hypothetical protein
LRGLAAGGGAGQGVGELVRRLFLPFAFCHLPFDLLVLERQFKIQMAKGKWQMWRSPKRIEVASRSLTRPLFLPFDFCHLPFDLLVREKQFKIQMAKGKWQKERNRNALS